MSDATVNATRDACASALTVLPLPALVWLHGRVRGGTFAHAVTGTAWLRKAMRRMAASRCRWELAAASLAVAVRATREPDEPPARD